MDQTPSCLDWVITDDPDIVEELTYEEPICKSDHLCLSWQLSFCKQSIADNFKYNYIDYMAEKLMQSGFFSAYQHGFIKGKSCTTNLLTAFETWTKWVDEGFGVDIVYLDYKKAFDSVNHVKFIEKLHHAGIHPAVIKWIAAFLQGRRMRVKVRLEFSDWVLVLSGVPQGSVLGPLLFLIFINDLPLWIRNSMLLLFADDTKLCRRIIDENDEILLQHDLDSLMEWTKRWCLQLNIEKCKVMKVAHSSQCEYKLDGVKIQEVQQERDLVVEVSCDLKPSLQCTKAVAKAMQVLGIVRRNFVMNDAEDFRLLFNGYVRPHLEYCVQVWSPYLRKDIIIIIIIIYRFLERHKSLGYRGAGGVSIRRTVGIGKS